MGEVLKTLAAATLQPRDEHNKRLFVDLSESVHIHYREHRWVFGVAEFRHFATVIAEAASSLEAAVSAGYRSRSDDECRRNVQVPTEVIAGSQVDALPLPQPAQSKYFDDRLVIEQQTPSVKDKFHVHYRDLRLVFNNDRTFLEVCDAFTRAAATYRADLALADVRPRWTREQVGPLDHVDVGVPILLDQSGVIIDGHHRYYAARARGAERIQALRLAMSFDESLPLRQFELALKETRQWGMLALYKRVLAQACGASCCDACLPDERLQASR
ncbi:MAG: hypothetical protein AB7H93_18125 [Vicinamibacterales bacterium]